MNNTSTVVYTSLLGKLTEDSAYLSGNEAQLISQTKDLIRTELQLLLNTRLNPFLPALNDVSLKECLFRYGIPDFTGSLFVSDEEKAVLCKYIAQSISRSEPRLSNILVEEATKAKNEDRAIRLRIKGNLIVASSRKPVVFDSVIDPVKRKINVESVNYG